ncbi:MAG TPA: twin-arginine translocase TatA/TatE family subunit [Cytophagales bacterium]|nr:twin-arginine translocase TatA/TatE family subunit [Cytophagales bacterium]HAA22504.1 twin-arginine translocase TatA/TatE family subunit [Cytophagales bacterium]HAP62153.1 twin-arginine translocase TatA/TatE family subunit [Cytophagales bacterium]
MATLFAWTLGGWEVLVIVLVILIFFGAKRIPELARSLGRGMREFKDATKEVRDEINQGGVNVNETRNPAPQNTNTAAPNTNSGSTQN